MIQKSTLHDTITGIRSKLVDNILRIIAILGFPALAASLFRALQSGWHPILLIHILGYLAILCTLLFRSRIRFQFRAFVVLTLPFALGVSGYMDYGLSSGGSVNFVLLTILATLFFGFRGGLIAFIIAEITLFLFILAINHGLLTFSIDFNRFNTLSSSWYSTFFFMAMWTGMIVVMINSFYSALLQTLEESRRKAEELEIQKKALSTSEERFSKIFHSSPVIQCITRLSDGTIMEVNDALIKHSGYTREEVIGTSTILLNIWEIPDHRNHVVEMIRQGKELRNIEARFNTRDRGVIICNTAYEPIEIDGETYVLTISENITERKMIEEEKEILNERLQQSHKMEALGTLAGGIAHDFNNILTVIMGYCEISKLKLGKDKDDEIKKNLDEVMKAGIRARDLVKQILTFSRQSRISREPMEITPLVKETIKFLRASLPSTIEITQDIPDELGIVDADATQIHQILMNICSNSAYAMKEKGGILDIRLKEIVIPGSSKESVELPDGTYICMSISDNGTGIQAGIIPRIFDPFFTTKERGKGTGMGLAVVHGIVSDMGGAITVRSTPGEGATFDVYFPQSSFVSEEAEPQSSRTSVGEARILFVDDEEGVLSVQNDILAQIGFTVTPVSSPLEALDIFTSAPDDFDCVLTDMTMPKMTGIELADRLKAIRPDIPIILCTGYSLDITPEKLMKHGLADMLMKPMSTHVMVDAINRAVSNNLPKR